MIRRVSSNLQYGNNECAGCVRWCTEPGIEVPRAGRQGEPLRELLVKPPGQCCPWIGIIEGRMLGCTIYYHPHRPSVCIAYVCEKLLPDEFSQG